jgi:hypothetical protein
MKQKWSVILGVTCVLLGASLVWLYTHPPLLSSGHHRRYDEDNKTLVYGIDLDNNCRWPVTLTSVTVNGHQNEHPAAMGVHSAGILAGNAAARLEQYGDQLQLGPVHGWKIPPQPQPPGPDSYAVRLDWQAIDATHAQVTIHYRYLGLPMQYPMDKLLH